MRFFKLLHAWHDSVFEAIVIFGDVVGSGKDRKEKSTLECRMLHMEVEGFKKYLKRCKLKILVYCFLWR